MTGQELTFSPRERGSHSPTKVTSWWIDGSRDRYGEAYFLSEETQVRSGSIKTAWQVWQNRRPYGVNQKVATLDAKPRSWQELDAAVSGRVES